MNRKYKNYFERQMIRENKKDKKKKIKDTIIGVAIFSVFLALWILILDFGLYRLDNHYEEKQKSINEFINK